MRPVDQTLLVERDGMGDCLRACVASVLEMEIKDVPLADRSISKMLAWLTEQSIHHDLLVPTMTTDCPDWVEYVVMCGPSPRNHLGGHSVVGKRRWSHRAGDWLWSVAHDPHPDRRGLGGPPDTIIAIWQNQPPKTKCATCEGIGRVTADKYVGVRPDSSGEAECPDCRAGGRSD